MMKKHLSYILISSALLFLFACAGFVKITLTVVDEEGLPIEAADAGVAFEKNIGWGTKVNPRDSLTNREGKATYSGQCNGHIAYGAEKDGYYPSYYTYDFKDEDLSKKEFTVLMRKIVNPVPMYARDIHMNSIEIPESNKDIGFDLVEFDWVAPYGDGKHPDFIFNLIRRRAVDRKDFDATLTLKFSNKFDGIQIHREPRKNGSIYRLPRTAPLDGYENTLTLQKFRRPGDQRITRNFDFLANDINYIFRIRSEEKEGKLVRAMYGKIPKDINFQFVAGSQVISKTTKIYFQYYLNPDYTRNLEFDRSDNLFRNLQWKVKAP